MITKFDKFIDGNLEVFNNYLHKLGQQNIASHSLSNVPYSLKHGIKQG